VSEGQKPSVGRIVHYLLPTAAGDVARPAIVTAVEPSGSISLVVFLVPGDDAQGASTDGHTLRRTSVPEAIEKFTVGTWRWPPRV
jgi:hypothetical protein